MIDKKIAVFFDCENVSSKYASEIFDELANHGEVTIRQAYKDWSSNHNKSWDEQLHKFAIKPIHTVSNTLGKNVSDFQIVIDIMNTIHSSKVDIIVIVSSDSDFTGLSIEIKSKGFEVIGFGESKTNDSFRNACSKFIELPIKVKTSVKDNSDVLVLLKDGINKTKSNNGYALVSKIGSYLINKNASFNAKNHGANTWGDIYKQYQDIFEIDYKDSKKSAMIVRLR